MTAIRGRFLVSMNWLGVITAKMTNTLKVAAVQLCSGPNVGENLETCSQLVEKAALDGAKVVSLPENFAYMGDDQGRLKIAESVPEPGHGQASGPITGWLTAVCRLHDIHLVASGLPETGPDDQHTYNTSVYYRPDGSCAARYRKIHLFDVSLA